MGYYDDSVDPTAIQKVGHDKHTSKNQPPGTVQPESAGHGVEALTANYDSDPTGHAPKSAKRVHGLIVSLRATIDAVREELAQTRGFWKDAARNAAKYEEGCENLREKIVEVKRGREALRSKLGNWPRDERTLREELAVAVGLLRRFVPCDDDPQEVALAADVWPFLDKHDTGSEDRTVNVRNAISDGELKI